MLNSRTGSIRGRVRTSTVCLCSILSLLGGRRAPDGRAQNPEPSYRNRTVPQWIEALRRADASGRAQAAYSLGQIRAEAAVTILQSVAQKDPDNFVRAEAVYALGNIGP